MKKKIDKKDLVLSLVLAFSFIAFVLVVTHFKYYYGSTLDWESQHSTIPEYFRLLFYKTKDLFPDFAFNLGNGQNIYNFSYYGFLSPLTFISYLLPFVPMIDYVIISTVASVIASGVLFYFFLRKNRNGNHLTSFLSSLALLFATSLSFHSHRHIMFINYMPFLILGLFGVDKRLENKKGWLLGLSVFLMVMTSYYYSVSGIIGLVLYGIYKYIEITPKVTFKQFLKDGLRFIVPIVIGILSSAIITIPTFYVILTGRGETFNTITLKDLIIPNINIGYMMYDSYGMGLSAVVLPAIVYLLLEKREKRFLGITLLLMLLFPFVNYLLNATMYIDSKVLIPMLPLAVLAIYTFMDALFEKKVDLKKVLIPCFLATIIIYFQGDITKAYLLDLGILTVFILLNSKFNKKILLSIPFVLCPIVVAYSSSFCDEYVKYEPKHKTRESLSKTLKYITDSDDSFYRISNAKTILRDVNNLYGNIDYYTSTLYSSTYNMAYNKFYYDVINNPIQNRNRVITSATANVMYLMLSGNKYLIQNKKPYHGYELLDEIDGNKVYKNENVLPLIYAQNRVMSSKDFEALGYPYQSEALLKNVIVEGESSSLFTSSIYKTELNLSELLFDNVTVAKEDDHYLIDAKDKARATLVLPTSLEDKILFIRFKELESNSCRDDDSLIVINGVTNKLTCKEWKYHNQNYQFDYVIAEKDLKELKIEFSKGIHKIKDIEVYALDYDEIKDIKNAVDELTFDKDKTKGDIIAGKIDVQDDGYLVTSIPYDEGFTIKIDGKKVDAVEVNKGFVGAKISKGEHDVEIEYQSPYKDIASAVSIIGIISFFIMVIYEKRTCKNN